MADKRVREVTDCTVDGWVCNSRERREKEKSLAVASVRVSLSKTTTTTTTNTFNHRFTPLCQPRGLNTGEDQWV